MHNRRRQKPVPTTAETPCGDDLVIVDVSHWQDDPIDWDEVRGEGVIGVILKATQGVDYVDPTFHQRYAEARSAGLCVSSYHFLEHGSVASQMQWYLDQVSPDDGERVVIDYEEESCTADDLVEAVEYLLADPRNLQITCYGSAKLTDDVNAAGNPVVLTNTSLWAARYSSNEPVIADVWPVWSVWQFTDNAQVEGFNGGVDGNRFNGTREACAEWFGPAGEKPKPKPQPEEVTAAASIGISGNIVTVAIEASPGAEVHVLLNGENLT